MITLKSSNEDFDERVLRFAFKRDQTSHKIKDGSKKSFTSKSTYMKFKRAKFTTLRGKNGFAEVSKKFSYSFENNYVGLSK